MPLVEYKTGVYAPDGYAEMTSECICDWEGCKNTADYQGLCEEHFFVREQEMATEITFTEISPSIIGNAEPFFLMHSACRYLMERETQIPIEATIARAEILWAASLCMKCAMETVRRAA